MLNINNFDHYVKVIKGTPRYLQGLQLISQCYSHVSPGSPLISQESPRSPKGILGTTLSRSHQALLRSSHSLQGLHRVSLESPQSQPRVSIGLLTQLLCRLSTILLNINNFVHYPQVSPGSPQVCLGSPQTYLESSQVSQDSPRVSQSLQTHGNNGSGKL